MNSNMAKAGRAGAAGMCEVMGGITLMSGAAEVIIAKESVVPATIAVPAAVIGFLLMFRGYSNIGRCLTMPVVDEEPHLAVPEYDLSDVRVRLISAP